MSRIASIFFFFLMAGPGFGQQEHFVLIHADNNQPFYVRIRQQTYSSSAQGHLILSQLHDSVYPITIGFPRQQYPEHAFTLTIDKNDLDLRLKDQDGKGWVLLDMGTQKEQLPQTDINDKKTRLEGVKKDDAFSRLMADVVSDTAVMYNTYAEEASRDSAARITDSLTRKSTAAAIKPDSPRVTSYSSALTLRKTIPPPVAPDSPANALRRTGPPLTTPDSAVAAFRVAIPTSPRVAPDSAALKVASPDSPATPPVPKAVAFTGTLDSTNTNSSIRHKDTTDNASALVQATRRPAKPAQIEKISQRLSPTALTLSYTVRRKGRPMDTINILIPIDTALTAGRHPDCHNIATDEDLARLKIKFQTFPADDAKIAAAKKVFELKCFTTNQLKVLSGAFPVEETKYRFLETAYPFVSDGGFRELSGLFTDPLYIAKFKTLAGINQ
jgi:hypothetical protein